MGKVQDTKSAGAAEIRKPESWFTGFKIAHSFKQGSATGKNLAAAATKKRKSSNGASSSSSSRGNSNTKGETERILREVDRSMVNFLVDVPEDKYSFEDASMWRQMRDFVNAKHKKEYSYGELHEHYLRIVDRNLGDLLRLDKLPSKQDLGFGDVTLSQVERDKLAQTRMARAREICRVLVKQEVGGDGFEHDAAAALVVPNPNYVGDTTTSHEGGPKNLQLCNVLHAGDAQGAATTPLSKPEQYFKDLTFYLVPYKNELVSQTIHKCLLDLIQIHGGRLSGNIGDLSQSVYPVIGIASDNVAGNRAFTEAHHEPTYSMWLVINVISGTEKFQFKSTVLDKYAFVPPDDKVKFRTPRGSFGCAQKYDVIVGDDTPGDVNSGRTTLDPETAANVSTTPVVQSDIPAGQGGQGAAMTETTSLTTKELLEQLIGGHHLEEGAAKTTDDEVRENPTGTAVPLDEGRIFEYLFGMSMAYTSLRGLARGVDNKLKLTTGSGMSVISKHVGTDGKVTGLETRFDKARTSNESLKAACLEKVLEMTAKTYKS